MAALPVVLALAGGAGTAYSAVQQHNATLYNAKVDQNEANLSIDQANAQEGMVRRASREALGRQASAFGAAGVGYGGSSGISLDQSAINQEHDALNTRYRGTLTAYGYGVQSGIDRSEANTEETSGLLTAAGKALKGASPYYSTVPPPPSGAQNSYGAQATLSANSTGVLG